LADEDLDESLTAWAKSKYAQTYIISFEKFLSTITVYEMPSLEDLWPDLEASTEEPIPEVASQLLYETIKRHALCLCGEDSPKSPKSIHGRLHLMGRTDNDKPGDYYFDTVFIARTDIHYSESQRWQLIRFKVPRFENSYRNCYP